MPNTFFTADSHYGHSNIVLATTKWTDTKGCRKLDSVEQMNDMLVEGINSVVKPDDVLYHLGDFNFGGLKNQREFRKRINCETIHLILGNHDFNHGQIDPSKIDHGFASIQPYKEIVVKGQEIVLNHYAQRVWNRQADGAWHLYGHSHGTLSELENFSTDVGVDGTGEFNPKPWEFSQLQKYFATHKLKLLDHHVAGGNNPPLKKES